MKNCPICKKKFIKQGLNNHIINTAEGESFRYLNLLLNAAKNKPSSAVMIRNMSHLAFWRRHLKDKKIFKI